MRHLEFRSLSKETSLALSTKLMAEGMSVDRIQVMAGMKVVAYGTIAQEALDQIMDDLGVQAVEGGE